MKKYIKHTITIYINSFKQWKKILLATIYDLTYWALFFTITYLIGLPLKTETTILQKLNFNQQALFTTSAAQINNTLIKTFITKAIIITLRGILGRLFFMDPLYHKRKKRSPWGVKLKPPDKLSEGFNFFIRI